MTNDGHPGVSARELRNLSPGRLRSITMVARIAWRDLLIDWRAAICVLMGFVAVIAPLMVLFGLKFGIMNSLRQQMLTDPKVLEIVLRGNHQLDEDWFAMVRAFPETRFIVPKTRSIAATMFVKHKASPVLGRAELAELIPSAEDDPLFPKGLAELQGDEVILSVSLAEMVGVEAGDELSGFVVREIDGRRERQDIKMKVKAVLRADKLRNDTMMVALPLMIAIEDYRDGYAVDDRGWTGGLRLSERTTFASARIYARSMQGLPALVDYLEDEYGLSVASRSADVEAIMGMDESLSLGFWIVAGIGGAGFFFSLAASLWSNVERKRETLGTLMLIGSRKQILLVFPVFQSLLLGGGGICLSLALFLFAKQFIERLFAGVIGVHGRDICTLLPEHVVIFVLATLSFSILASMWATWQISRVGIAQSLRER